MKHEREAVFHRRRADAHKYIACQPQAAGGSISPR